MANKVSNSWENRVRKRIILLDYFFSFLGGHCVLRFGRRYIGSSDMLSAVDDANEIDHSFSHLRLDANAVR